MEANDMKALREACTNIAEYADAAKCHTTDAHILGYLDQIGSWAKAALAKPPRACDDMSQEDLTNIVISGFMKSLGIGQKNQLVIQLAKAAISAAITCAYDTQLVSKGEEGAK